MTDIIVSIQMKGFSSSVTTDDFKDIEEIIRFAKIRFNKDVMKE